jgi:hypothetical protein
VAVVLLLAAFIGAGIVVLLHERRESQVASRPNMSQPTALSQPTPETTGKEVNQPSQSVPTAQLDGEWQVVNSVRDTSYKPYENLQLSYRIVIDQNGSQFSARGEKVSEGNSPLDGAAKTPIELRGSIEGDLIRATFVEEGTRRRSGGRFSWKLDPNGNRLVGTFSSSAARTSGSSIATKVNGPGD